MIVSPTYSDLSTNYLSFPKFENVFLTPSFLKDSSAQHRISGCRSFRLREEHHFFLSLDSESAPLLKFICLIVLCLHVDFSIPTMVGINTFQSMNLFSSEKFGKCSAIIPSDK